MRTESRNTEGINLHKMRFSSRAPFALVGLFGTGALTQTLIHPGHDLPNLYHAAVRNEDGSDDPSIIMDLKTRPMTLL